MASFRARGKSVQVQIRLMGVTDSASFPSMGKAREWARSREAEIQAGARGMIVGGKTLAQAIDKFIDEAAPHRKSRDKEIVRLRAFKRDWTACSKPIAKVSSDDIAQFRDWRLQTVSGSSVRREMTLLSAVFELARTEWKWVLVNPIRDVRKPRESKARARLVLPREYRAILAAGDYRPGQRPKNKTQLVVAAWCLALRTGMRAGEILKLRWRHVDLKRRTAELLDTKNGTDRTIPLFPRAVRILERLKPHPARPDQQVFDGLNSASLDALFRKTRDRAGVEELHFHDSRHTATTMFARFLPVLDLARVIGHLNVNQLLTYYNESAASIADRVHAASQRRRTQATASGSGYTARGN